MKCIIDNEYEFSDNGDDWELGILNHVSEFAIQRKFQSGAGNEYHWFRFIREVVPVPEVGDLILVSYLVGHNKYHGKLEYIGKQHYVINFIGTEVWVLKSEVTITIRYSEEDKLVTQLTSDLSGGSCIFDHCFTETAEKLVKMGWVKISKENT